MRLLRPIAIICLLFLPAPACAHANIPGIGGFYAAFWHTISEQPAPLILLGLGLLVGLHGTEAFRWAWIAFFLAMLGGLIGILGFGIYVDPELPLLLLALITALYTAGALPLPNPAAAVIGALSGYFFGVFIAPEVASWSTQAYAIAGGLIAANFAFLFIVSAIDTIRTQWQMPWVTVGLRVIASWIAAIAVLMVALSAR
jgi:HupE / UreJ protein